MSNRCDGWCGECYSNARGRTNYRGHVCYRRPRVPRVLQAWEVAVKKPIVRASGVVDTGAPSSGAFFSPFPLVWEMLTCDAYEDGAKRQRASILVICDGACLKLWLNDKDLGRSAWVSGESLEDALGSMEALIHNDSMPWRASDSKKPAKK